MPQDFNQANALIARLMEGVGGSANAYEEPIDKDPETPTKGAPDTISLDNLPPVRTVGINKDGPLGQELGPAVGPLPNNCPGLADPPHTGLEPGESLTNAGWSDHDQPAPWTPSFEGETDDSCAEGFEVDWAKVEGPEPISDRYESVGTVEESEELMVVYYAMQQAVRSGILNPVSLDTGTYNVVPGAGEGCFLIIDTGKARSYILETSRLGEMAEVPTDKLFVWVLDTNDEDGKELGYIQDGWVFFPKA
jgi:hypothetical protein